PGGDLAVASQVGGRITRITVREGQRIAAGDIVATVDDTTSRDAVRQADAALDQARANQTNADALLARTQELVARGIAARQELEGNAPQVPIGTYGRVSIVTRHRDAVPTLPAAALRGAVLDGAEVVVCKDGKADVRTAKVGYRDDRRFEILDGVAPGERVAID